MSKTIPCKVLIIDDEAPIREVLAAALRDEGHTVDTAKDGESGLAAIRQFHPQVVFLDIWMPGSMDGIEVLNRARREFPEVDFVMISGHGTIETAVKATKLGVWDFIEKPLSMDKIFIGISNIIQYQHEKQEKEALLNRFRRNIALLGESQSMVSLKQSIASVAPTQSTVLIFGENGSGRNLVSQNIHYFSDRASHSFVEVNCGDLVEDLVDAEFFGYESGAIAGSSKLHRGKLELANGGTLFLDDIADLNSVAQGRLVEFLKSKSIRRLGGQSDLVLDVRVIAVTRKSLEEEIAQGRFREDLFRYLNESIMRTPALRDHSEDIPTLINHFSDIVAKDGGFTKKEFSEQGLHAMRSYDWPGNVRELRNFIERVYILTPSDFVDVHDLRFAGLPQDSGKPIAEMSSFREARAQFEKEYLVRKISENNGNISRTAELIGLERSYLHRKIKAFGLEMQKGSEEQS